MAFKKQYLKSKPVCKVTFKISKEEAKAANSVSVVGDFNDWDKSSTVMKKLKNGSFSASLDLPVEKDYQFRYLLDGKAYENDWQADAYTVSPMSNEENSVIKL
ncbi:isoamylase early set domain-containing protein [Paraglaciecola polaris]|uniref:Isoamylase protein-like n=1 Tax=Paraglaciecola polaris LMG 21857 TaxID=1129793 RepID=K6ZVT2_9ALTE|nr:isoamylase early set domain-containing protein [Paraglaciecola polaris]GAC32898.1 isoamylase protein-like [Paraglaciecola polaris LMG 21857]|tara:strand:+ start:523 stop:831 length:309 start_codon:yes stop_codon:yes gene_type:complete